MKTDVHSERAAKIFGVPVAEVTAEQRNYAKMYAHREAYSFGAISFVEALRKLPPKKAKA